MWQPLQSSQLQPQRHAFATNRRSCLHPSTRTAAGLLGRNKEDVSLANLTKLCKSGVVAHFGRSRSACLHKKGYKTKEEGYACSHWQPSFSVLLAGAFTIHAAISPLLLPLPQAKAAQLPAEASTTALQQLVMPMYEVSDAPDVHAQPEAADQQQWWQQDQKVWQELTSPAELTAFLSASQPSPSPASPALDSSTLNPRLRLLEFYAGWCPACKAAAPGMAEVAGDPELCQHVTFARVNIDRVKPLVRQLGITKIPTVLLLGPDGKTLDSFRASGQAARDALQLQLAAMKQQQLLLLAAPGLGQGRGPEEQLAASEVGEDDSSGSRGSNVSNGPDASTVTGSNSSSGGGGSSGSGVTCGTSPEPACGNLPPGIQPADTPAVPSSTAASAANSSSSSSGPQAPVDAGLAAAKQQFMQQYGSGYGYGGWLEQHYQQEVGERLGPGKHYLDYTGAALYPASLLQAVYDDLVAHQYGNPHSAALAANVITGSSSNSSSSNSSSNGSSTNNSSSNGSSALPPAAASEAVMEAAAAAVLSHLHADPAEYQVVFTRSATDALKLVGELFPWGGRSVGVGVSTQQSSTPSELDMLQDSSTQQPVSTSEASEGAQSSSGGGSSGSTGSRSGSSGSSSSISTSRKGRFVYTRSNHNSVLGIGAYAAAAGAELVPQSDQGMEAWVQSLEQQQQGQQEGQQQQQQGLLGEQEQGVLGQAASGSAVEPVYNLLAYPAEDNFAGVVYPLQWINRVHAANSPTERTLVLLDAAAYLPTHELDLSQHPADFVAASFYKMFGYPTGLGALVLRTEHVPLLNKVYFGGGSVALATPEGCWHVGKCDPAAALSDGTPNYLGAAALKLAFEAWDSRGGMQAVDQHTQALGSWLWRQLSSLHHTNGAPLLQLYGRHGQQGAAQQATGLNQAAGAGFSQAAGAGFSQSAVFNFQVLRPDGQPVSFSQVDRDATAAGIYLRSGCVCNPGACYDAVGLQASEVQALAGLKEGCGDEMDFATVMRPASSAGSTGSNSSWWPWRVGTSSEQPGSAAAQLVPTEVPLGSVRASLGWASTFEDAYALVQFARGYLS